RPDIASLTELFSQRAKAIADSPRKPFWYNRLTGRDFDQAQDFLVSLSDALEPLAALRSCNPVSLSAVIRASVEAVEALAREEDGSLAAFYDGQAGEALARFLRELIGTQASIDVDLAEWPDIFDALMAGIAVKPPVG